MWFEITTTNCQIVKLPLEQFSAMLISRQELCENLGMCCSTSTSASKLSRTEYRYNAQSARNNEIIV